MKTWMIVKGYLLLRIFFILLLLSTGIGKLLDIPGFASVIATYQFSIPTMLLAPLALAVAQFELLLGIAIWREMYLKWCAVLTILMHMGYTLLAIVTNIRGIELNNCGCFGVFLARPMTWGTVVEDTILTLLSVAFYLSIQHRNKILESSKAYGNIIT